ncbi:MAG: hypothetical protein IE891_01030 [Flavobacteriaceae bacterium]|nr:hypothetical protein [Flavobacteriaceae bacterium]
MNSNYKIENQKDAVIHFISKFDLEMIDAILDEQYNYNDYGKDELLYNLKVVFRQYAEEDDDYLEVNKNSCDCSLKDECNSAVTFVGNNSRRFLDLIIETKNEQVVDIYECTSMKDDYSLITNRKRIFLDETPF